MSFDPALLLLVIPAAATALIAALPGTRASAYVNAGASFLTLLGALYRAWTGEERSGAYLLVDELNTIFLVLVAFVGFTTSVFSANYVAYDLRSGRVTPAFLRLYHALYQALALAFNVALLSNNLGVLWVAIELATLITVVMVGIYGTTRRSRRRGNISSWRASASRSPCLAPSFSIWRRRRP